MEGEKTIRSIGIHWKNYIFPVLVLALTEMSILIRYELMDVSLINAYLGGTIGAQPVTPEIQHLLSLMEIILLAALSLKSVFKIIETAYIRYILTDKRIIVKRGVLAKSENEMILSSCWNVQMTQSVYERIFNTGDILLCSAAASFYLDDVRKVKEFKTLIEQQIKR